MKYRWIYVYINFDFEQKSIFNVDKLSEKKLLIYFNKLIQLWIQGFSLNIHVYFQKKLYQFVNFNKMKNQWQQNL